MTQQPVEDKQPLWVQGRTSTSVYRVVGENWEYADAQYVNAIEAALAEARTAREEAEQDARRWKGHHDTQVRWKRRGREAMKAHYEAALAASEARVRVLEAQVAQYQESKYAALFQLAQAEARAAALESALREIQLPSGSSNPMRIISDMRRIATDALSSPATDEAQGEA
jgi:hypothetical protein